MRRRQGQTQEKFRRPELFLVDLLRRSARGELSGDRRVIHRATVVAVDTVGGRLENPDGSGTLTSTIDGKDVTVGATRGPANPKNSIRARIITDAFDQFIPDAELRTFWPLFSDDHQSFPIKPGEHVYVIFEDVDLEHGLWVGRMSGQDDANFVRGQDFFHDPSSGGMSQAFGFDEGSDPSLRTDVSAGEAVVASVLADRFGFS